LIGHGWNATLPFNIRHAGGTTFIFKTSGATIRSVVANQKHAFRGKPVDWYKGEWVLVSKNRQDCHLLERQIQYVMRLGTIRPLERGEAELYWHNSEGRWQYLFSCTNTVRLARPFNLGEPLGTAAEAYRGTMTFKRLTSDDERRVYEFIERSNPGLIEGMQTPLG
jgi:hypothetical protein